VSWGNIQLLHYSTDGQYLSKRKLVNICSGHGTRAHTETAKSKEIKSQGKENYGKKPKIEHFPKGKCQSETKGNKWK
jgi:hypothetical protein